MEYGLGGRVGHGTVADEEVYDAVDGPGRIELPYAHALVHNRAYCISALMPTTGEPRVSPCVLSTVAWEEAKSAV